MSLQSINPATGELVKEYPFFSIPQTDQIIDEAHNAWLQWRTTDLHTRAACMRRIAARLEAQQRDLAELITLEMGKSVKSARAEIEKCAWGCNYFADNAAELLRDEIIKTEAGKTYIHFEPLGVILAVMPWNFPFWQLFRFAAPALMAGNACVLKHASNVSGSALALEQLFKEAGFPENLMRTLLIGSDRVEDIIWNKKIRAVTLTGSTDAGSQVAAVAGRALKKSVMELGGSDPYVILEDADIKHAATICATGRLINNGQSCIAAKRFIIVDAVYAAFEKAFIANMKAARLGDPLHEDTELGPLARADLRTSLHKQVTDSIAAGARCVLGGEIPKGAGNYYPATVLSDVKPGMPAFDEELFGPVAALIRAKDTEEAIQLANATQFGLGAAVFTQDIKKGETIAAQRLDAGFCAVNDIVRSDPRLPFGGIKDSGFGRELSHYGIKEFVNIKTVYIK
ncbi:MAG TPA: NAD-dependent succinate-semialdehyde dehydrogenase [Gammaproteobacteria bacterium]